MCRNLGRRIEKTLRQWKLVASHVRLLTPDDVLEDFKFLRTRDCVLIPTTSEAKTSGANARIFTWLLFLHIQKKVNEVQDWITTISEWTGSVIASTGRLEFLL